MTTIRHRILILGHGEMGQAIAHLLRGQQVDIWEKFPQGNFKSVVLEDAARHADIVIFCLPVNPHREIVEQITPYLRKSCVCVSIAKGLDEAGHTAAQIFAKNLPLHQVYALLYGPMISEEIRADRYAFAQLGSNDAGADHKLRTCFHGSHLYIEQTSDITGISWSVILKNVYALLFGMADELKLGDNMRGFLVVAALRELNQIVCEMGGQANSSYHLAGLGDLITTATSNDSHHHELGRKLARGETQGIEGEGIHTLKMVNRHRLFTIADYPLFKLTDDIIQQPQEIKKRFGEYLKQAYLY